MKPLLLLDVGNTRLKWAAVSPRGAIQVRGQMETTRVTARWVSAFAKQHATHAIVVASVVPDVSRLLRRSIPSALLVKGNLRHLPLTFAYPRPAEIGADRIAAALGAKARGPAIVISCGTATAFSAIDRRGRFCGGAITPGLNAQLRTLAAAAAQLPATTLGRKTRALGRSTRAAIRAGVLLGWQGGVREIVEQLRREIGAGARVIVTGGEAQHLHGVRGLGRVAFRPLLVFEGLRIIAASLFDR